MSLKHRPELMIVPDSIGDKNQLPHRELLKSIVQELDAAGKELEISVKDFTPDVLDVVMLAKLTPIMSLVAMEHAKHAFQEHGGNKLVWFRRIALEVKKE
jgi:hypothetical protein